MASRRDILKGLGAVGASSLLPACSDNDNKGDGSSPPPGSGEFDYPTGHALPFAHGVASGDPLADRVILWTRITEVAPSAAAIPVSWTMSLAPDMSQPVASGTQDAVAAHDWTIKVDAVGLSPATTYYYRFSALGAQSAIGRTRTAPSTAVEQIRIAVLACSSYWSSYWSGLSHIAARNDLDLVIHCGDYIYDFVDEDETVRARGDRFDTAYVDYRDWLNLDECRRRYALWHSDPNLLRAHQQHPWMIVWDNHDISTGFGNELPVTAELPPETTTLDDVCRAFHEWTPTRPVRADGSGEFLLVNDGSYPEPPDVRLVWRKLDYGPLLDIYGVDTQINLRDDVVIDSSHLPEGTPSLFGRAQYEWLTAQMLAAAQAGKTWRLVNNQTWIAPWNVPGVLQGMPLNSPIATRWSDYREERAQLFRFMRGENDAGLRIRNNVFVSGDMHGNWASDLIEDNALVSGYVSGLPLPNLRAGSTVENQLAGYGRATTANVGSLNLRADSVGVEFAPTSMGRGGGDEIIANAAPGTPFAATVLATRALELASITANKNVQFQEWVDHGYGIVHLEAERGLFEFWWQDKLTPDSPDVLGCQMVCYTADDPLALPSPRYADQIDVVTLHGMPTTASAGTRVCEPAPAANFIAG
jgi:alkaline phosphatase D